MGAARWAKGSCAPGKGSEPGCGQHPAAPYPVQEQVNGTSRLAEPQRWSLVVLTWLKASSSQPDISHLF